MLGRKFKLIAIAGLILVLIVALILFDMRIKASVLTLARAKVQLSETELINQVVNQEVVARTCYEDLVQIHKDDNGRIVLIQPNAIMISKIMASTTIKITQSLSEMREQDILVPLGQMSGATLFAGYGPKIKVKVIPCGQVQVDIINRFDEAGVNQTRHLIYCRVRSTIKLAVPMMDEEIKVSTTIPLAETIIIGDVPKTYVNYTGNQNLPYSITNEDQETLESR